MDTTTPALSIVIPCTRPKAVTLCIDGLAKQVSDHSIEAFVVGDVDSAETRFDGLHVVYISCPERHANVRRNMGIRRARAPRIAFLDDDAAPLPGWLDTVLKFNPADRQVWTGPEKPVIRGWVSKLLFAVCQNRFLDGTAVHVNPDRAPVSWWEVPFCNLLAPRDVFQHELLSTDIPWDMDDFDFCSRIRSRVSFYNMPEMVVCHDRYPDSFMRFFLYRWRLRVRTGEKLISHPSVYGRIFPVVVCAAFPWVLVFILWFLPVSFSQFFSFAGSLYLAFLLSQLGIAYHRTGGAQAFLYVALLGWLHVITLSAVQFGLWLGSLKKIRSWLFRVK